MDDEIDYITNLLKSKANFEFPKYENTSIPKEGLTISKDKYRIYFKGKNNYFDIISKKFYFNGEEIFEGSYSRDDSEFHLTNGKYIWPSGQIFEGKVLYCNKYKGELKFGTGCIYKGGLNNNNFEEEGELYWNSDEFVKSKFKDGQIFSETIIKRNNYYIEADFQNSMINGKVSKFDITLNGHSYQFDPFNFSDEKIKEEKIKIRKDGKEIILNNKMYKKIYIDPNKKKITITKDELKELNKFFNIFDGLVPNIEIPSISNQELIDTTGNFEKIEFSNGAVADYDDKNDRYILTLNNKEKFTGILDNNENNQNSNIKYYLVEGKYTWPSGQEYNGKFNEKNQFNSDDANLEMKGKWIYEGPFEDGKISGNGKFKWEKGPIKSLDGYFKDGRLYGNTTIDVEDGVIKGVLSNSSINEIEIQINEQIYKVQKIDKTIKDEQLLVIEKGDNEYFLLLYYIINGKIIIEEYDSLPPDEKDSLINHLFIYIECIFLNYSLKKIFIIKNDIIIKILNLIPFIKIKKYYIS